MASQGDTTESFILESVVRGHHIYKRIWTPVLGERLQVKVEEDNSNDARAVAVQKCGVVVGHLPREIARIVWYFLKRGGLGWCEITGRRKKGKGLEVPCVYTFSGPHKLVKKLETLVQECHIKYDYSCPSF